MLNMDVKSWIKKRLKSSKKKELSQKTQISKYWNDLKIPAYLFFDIIKTSDLSLLVKKGSPNVNELMNAWENIYDLYFEKKDDTKLRLILKTRADIQESEFRIQTIKNVINVFRTLPLTKEQQLKLINKLKEIDVFIDYRKDLLNEIHRIITIYIPQLETRLKIDKLNLEELTKGKETDFNDACVSIENILDRTINEKVSLAKFLSLEKAADKKVKSLEKSNKK